MADISGAPVRPVPAPAPAPAPAPKQPLKNDFLMFIHYSFPIFLLSFYFIFLAIWSIYSAGSSKKKEDRPGGVAAALRQRAAKNNGTTNYGATNYGNGAPEITGDVGSGSSSGNNSASPKNGNGHVLGRRSRIIFNWASVILCILYILDAVNVILHALTEKGWWGGKDLVIYTGGLIFATLALLLSQVENEGHPALPHASSWVVIFVVEIILLGQMSSIYTKDRSLWNKWQTAQIAVAAFRIMWVGLMSAAWFAMYCVHSRQAAAAAADSEASPLLGSGSQTPPGYGATDSPVKPDDEDQPRKPRPAGWERPKGTPDNDWWDYLKGYGVFFPYLWPSKDKRLQIVMVMCFILVLLQRGINVLVPNQLGVVTDILSGENGEEPRVPWLQISLYILYRFLQGNMGVLGAIRSILWIPIGQYSYRALSTSAFEHVHSLSLDFHLGKKTGEVLSALSKGASINNFLEMVTFQVLPMMLDLGVAVVYFLTKFDAYYALIVVIVVFFYMYVTVKMAAWRAAIRREMVNKSREEDAVKNDSMIAYETVKYFNAESYEFSRYGDAVRAYQRAEYTVLSSLNLMNITQNLMFTLGLVAACYLSAYQVSMGYSKVGKFVVLLTYMAQLQGPLNFFGTFYRSIQSSMINAERMLELFKEQPTVVDEPEAVALKDCRGELEFDSVQFSYDRRKPALKGLSFKASPGTTTAFVGESGGGKTTILRLIFRFYNPTSGSIRIDGKDVRDVTINSFREKIGVVPQDTVLFNETLMYNLKYANPKATDDDVYNACMAASIHERILTFPDGYNTKVGERGLKLSGGEIQRVAIARTILKNPKIILLDEATASLDSDTEQHIQSALRELTEGRTTLVIAHRLSTITNANQIVVIHQGRVSEIGTHEELLAKNGRYANMWAKQIRAETKKSLVAELDLSSGYNTPAEPETSGLRPIIQISGAPTQPSGHGGNGDDSS